MTNPVTLHQQCPEFLIFYRERVNKIDLISVKCLNNSLVTDILSK